METDRKLRTLIKAIELGWDGPDSSMTMDQIIESKKISKLNDTGKIEA